MNRSGCSTSRSSARLDRDSCGLVDRLGLDARDAVEPRLGDRQHDQQQHEDDDDDEDQEVVARHESCSWRKPAGGGAVPVVACSSSSSRPRIAAVSAGVGVVVAEDVEHAVHDEQGELVVDGAGVRGGLLGGDRRADHDVAQQHRDAAVPDVVVVGVERERQHVGRAVACRGAPR